MARKAKTPVSGPVTRRRLARWQRERRRRRITLLIGSIVIVVTALIIAYGFYSSSCAPQRQWITRVGTNETYTVFRSSDYVHALRLIELGFYSPETTYAAEGPLVVLESNELVRQGADEAGVGAPTDAEIKERVKEMMSSEGEELTDEEYRQALQNVVANTGLSESEFLKIVEQDLLGDKLDQYLRDSVPEVGEILPHVHLEAIVAESEELAGEAMDRLNAGEDFTDLTLEYGGGDLGWMPEGLMSADIQALVYSLEIGNVTEPIQTELGFTIIQLLGKEDRALEEGARATLQENAFSLWLEEMAEERVQRNPGVDWDAKYSWALAQLS
ncbi:MAG: peptidylprolyl isomerase [Chloroflexota bacterium]|nr:peptidylprolyl isomerase [Chloroflexota bacterium]